MHRIKAIILEFTSGEFEGNNWAKVKARSAEIADNKILTYKVDVKKAGDISKFLDTECELTLDVARGKDDVAVLKIVGVE